MSAAVEYLKPDQALTLDEVPPALRERMLDALGEPPWLRSEVYVRYVPPGHVGPNTDLQPLAPKEAPGRAWGEFAVEFTVPSNERQANPAGYPTLREYGIRLVPLSERPKFFHFEPGEEAVWVPPPICRSLGCVQHRQSFYACTEEAFELVRSLAEADIDWRHVPLPQPSDLVGDLFVFEVRQSRCIDYWASDVTWMSLPLGRDLSEPVFVVPNKLHEGTVFIEDAVRGRHLVQPPGGQIVGETFASPELIEGLRALGAETYRDDQAVTWFERDEG